MSDVGPPIFTASPKVLARVLDGEAVLLDLGGGNYFGLNEVGTTLWSAIESGATLEELVAKVVATYDVSFEVARADVASLLDELRAQGLVTETLR
jgi:hypothetical protein